MEKNKLRQKTKIVQKRGVVGRKNRCRELRKTLRKRSSSSSGLLPLKDENGQAFYDALLLFMLLLLLLL